ncbi:hypothetical protein D920_02626, partial [Enterococcus faecalis 13-SD-W-01]
KLSKVKNMKSCFPFEKSLNARIRTLRKQPLKTVFVKLTFGINSKICKT